MDITLYLVGTDEEDAFGTFPFSDEDSAESYQRDNPGTQIYTVSAFVDETTIQPLN